MNYKVGQELYSYYGDWEDGTLDSSTYVVRTIRGGKVYAIQKNEWTWGKKSKKHGDFGWLDPIPAWFRRKAKVGEVFVGLHTTKRQALIAAQKSNVESSKFAPMDEQDEKNFKRIQASIKRELTKLKNKKESKK